MKGDPKVVFVGFPLGLCNFSSGMCPHPARMVCALLTYSKCSSFFLSFGKELVMDLTLIAGGRQQPSTRHSLPEVWCTVAAAANIFLDT